MTIMQIHTMGKTKQSTLIWGLYTTSTVYIDHLASTEYTIGLSNIST